MRFKYRCFFWGEGSGLRLEVLALLLFLLRRDPELGEVCIDHDRLLLETALLCRIQLNLVIYNQPISVQLREHELVILCDTCSALRSRRLSFLLEYILHTRSQLASAPGLRCPMMPN